jgi:hypothetical protein
LGVLTSSNPLGVAEIAAVLPKKITVDMNLELVKEVTMEEVSLTLNQMSPFKVPGPDGFNASFYQDHWSDVGKEVFLAIKFVFSLGSLFPVVNSTLIALVPKKADSMRVSDYRPISLCNVLYKIISKVLANRLKTILPNIISCNQSTFIRVA